MKLAFIGLSLTITVLAVYVSSAHWRRRWNQYKTAMNVRWSLEVGDHFPSCHVNPNSASTGNGNTFELFSDDCPNPKRNGPRWVCGARSCNVQCDMGTQTRSVTCENAAGNSPNPQHVYLIKAQHQHLSKPCSGGPCSNGYTCSSGAMYLSKPNYMWYYLHLLSIRSAMCWWYLPEAVHSENNMSGWSKLWEPLLMYVGGTIPCGSCTARQTLRWWWYTERLRVTVQWPQLLYTWLSRWTLTVATVVPITVVATTTREDCCRRCESLQPYSVWHVCHVLFRVIVIFVKCSPLRSLDVQRLSGRIISMCSEGSSAPSFKHCKTW